MVSRAGAGAGGWCGRNGAGHEIVAYVGAAAVGERNIEQAARARWYWHQLAADPDRRCTGKPRRRDRAGTSAGHRYTLLIATTICHAYGDRTRCTIVHGYHIALRCRRSAWQYQKHDCRDYHWQRCGDMCANSGDHEYLPEFVGCAVVTCVPTVIEVHTGRYWTSVLWWLRPPRYRGR